MKSNQWSIFIRKRFDAVGNQRIKPKQGDVCLTSVLSLLNFQFGHWYVEKLQMLESQIHEDHAKTINRYNISSSAMRFYSVLLTTDQQSEIYRGLINNLYFVVKVTKWPFIVSFVIWSTKNHNQHPYIRTKLYISCFKMQNIYLSPTGQHGQENFRAWG